LIYFLRCAATIPGATKPGMTIKEVI
jgi:hypothetical protein